MVKQAERQITFLFTRIEDAARRWEQQPESMREAAARHEIIVRQMTAAHGGIVFQAIGHELCVAFSEANAALVCGAALQSELSNTDWGASCALKVAMALHTGPALERDGSYFAPPTLNRLSRILAVAHGGQVLLAAATAEQGREQLPPYITLRDLGERRLRDISQPEHLYQLVAPGLTTNFPPLKTLDSRPHNLPAQTTSFIGREHEVVAVGQLLQREEGRIVTLTGPGGTGKTRLSMEVAASLIDEFADGVCFVELAFTTDPQMVASAIARALGMIDNASQRQTDLLKEYLSGKQMLLVLDNFEQVIASAPFIAELSEAAPHLKILVSSRERLHLEAEREYPVSGLAVPAARRYMSLEELAYYPSIALFKARASTVRFDFALTEQNVQAIADICAKLDGLPLAIELAAARVRLLHPHEILAGLSSRLQLLNSGVRNLPLRQRSLRGAIDWSHDLLTPEEKVLFARLSVFVGGCSVEAAEAVCNARGDLSIAVDEGLTRLADKSLLVSVSHPPTSESDVNSAAGGRRFVMLETIREYALERLAEHDRIGSYLQASRVGGDRRVTMPRAVQEYALSKLAASGEEESLRRYHASYYLQLAEQSEPKLRSGEQAAWVERLAEEHDNLRTAITWLLSNNEATMALRIAGSLFWFWSREGYFSDGRSLLRRALSATGAEPWARAKALFAAGGLARLQQDPAEGEAQLEESAALFRQLHDQQGLAYALVMLGDQHGVALDRRQVWLGEAETIFRAIGDRWGYALTLNYLGYVAQGWGQFELAQERYSECLAIFRELGDRWGEALPLFSLAYLAYEQGDLGTARRWAKQNLAARRTLGDRMLTASALNMMGELMRDEDYHAALAYYDEAQALYREINLGKGVVMVLRNKAETFSEKKDYEQALATLLEELAIQREREYRDGIGGCLLFIATLFGKIGKLGVAATLLGAVAALQATRQANYSSEDELQRAIISLREQMDSIDFDSAWQEGSSMSPADVITYASAAVHSNLLLRNEATVSLSREE